MRRLMVLLFVLGAAAAVSQAESTPSPALLVLSKQDHTLAIVDPRDLHVVARAPVGVDPHEVIASTDGRTAYVSNYGFGQFHTITMIDLIGPVFRLNSYCFQSAPIEGTLVDVMVLPVSSLMRLMLTGPKSVEPALA